MTAEDADRIIRLIRSMVDDSDGPPCGRCGSTDMSQIGINRMCRQCGWHEHRTVVEEQVEPRVLCCVSIPDDDGTTRQALIDQRTMRFVEWSDISVPAGGLCYRCGNPLDWHKDYYLCREQFRRSRG